ncbi:hypothetical protein [Streptomyces camponoticapitis]|nr:hypothetical protein [Streptomyces camponoticapitis]
MMGALFTHRHRRLVRNYAHNGATSAGPGTSSTSPTDGGRHA